VAAGGEGAPLLALVEERLLGGLPRPAAVLNLGGIANLTLLGGEGAPVAFDVGPANALLDGLARAALDRPMDEDGRAAAAGTPREELVRALLAHPFLAAPPPKSTGRDTFGAEWVGEVLERAAGLEPPLDDAADLLATGVEVVARSVAGALAEHGPPDLAALAVAGGGARNGALLARLADLVGVCGCAVRPSDAWGVDADAREALGFALLGALCVLGVPVTAPEATGARAGSVLGRLAPGRPGDPGKDPGKAPRKDPRR
jgi:anhydro-N-acetylmuramic acid kinase